MFVLMFAGHSDCIKRHLIAVLSIFSIANCPPVISRVMTGTRAEIARHHWKSEGQPHRMESGRSSEDLMTDLIKDFSISLLCLLWTVTLSEHKVSCIFIHVQTLQGHAVVQDTSHVSPRFSSDACGAGEIEDRQSMYSGGLINSSALGQQVIEFSKHCAQ